MLTDAQKLEVSEMLQNMWEAFERCPMPERKLHVYLQFLGYGLPNLANKDDHFDALMTACKACIGKGSGFPLIRDLYYDWVPDRYLQHPRIGVA